VWAMARTAQAYGFAAAGRSPEGLAVLDFLAGSGNEVPVSETDALIMRGMLKLYVDDLSGSIADLGIAAARLRTGLPATYPVTCLAQLSDAQFRRGDWDAAIKQAQLAIALAQDADRPLDLARAHARAAQILSFRGDSSSAQAHVREARTAAERFPLVLPVANATMAAASLASARSEASGLTTPSSELGQTPILDQMRNFVRPPRFASIMVRGDLANLVAPIASPIGRARCLRTSEHWRASLTR
jgi:tetratricopeptide (TPR) repeat protein